MESILDVMRKIEALDIRLRRMPRGPHRDQVKAEQADIVESLAETEADVITTRRRRGRLHVATETGNKAASNDIVMVDDPMTDVDVHDLDAARARIRELERALMAELARKLPEDMEVVRELTAGRARIAQLETELAAAHETRGDHGSEAAAMSKAATIGRVEELLGKIAAAEDEARSWRHKVSVLEARVPELTKAVEAERARADELQRERAATAARLAEANERCDATVRQLAEVEAQATKTAGASTDAEDRLTRIAGALLELVGQLREASSRAMVSYTEATEGKATS